MKYSIFGRKAGFLVALILWGFCGMVVAQTSSADPMPGNSVEKLNVTRQGTDIIVRMSLRQPLSALPASFSIANPARIAFDLPSTGNGLGRTVQQVNDGDLGSINVVQVGDRTRVVLNLRRNLPFDAHLDGTALVVMLHADALPDAAAAKVTHFADSKPQEAPQSVRDLKFRRGKNGEGLVVVELSDPNVGIDIRQMGSNLVVDFAKAALPENLRRRLDVTDFATPVTNVNAHPQGDGTRLVITPRGLWEHNAYQSDNQFVVEVKQVVEDPNKLVQGSRGGYQGEKLSLNFQNVEVRSVLQVISDFTNLNIVVSDSVSGALTLRLKDVPWDQALDIILNTRGLDMRKSGNVIWIAPRDELAAKEKLNLESRQQISELEITRTEAFQLNYHKAKAIVEFLKSKDQTLLSKRGTVVADERSNKLFISDVPSKLDEIRGLIKEIDVPVRQVMIEARIVEADDGFVNKLGVRLGGSDWAGVSGEGHKVLGAGGLRYGLSGSANAAFINSADYRPVGTYTTPSGLMRFASYSGTASPDALQFVNLPVSGAAGSINLSLYNAAKTQMVNLELTALESDNRGKTISNPRVLTADQVEAIIEQGDEVPYLSATSSGATSVAFKKATLSLKVKPQITPDGRIIMTLDIHKDAIGAATNAGPAIATKQVKTEVLVDNGGTVVIGGIYTQNERNDTTRVPVLGDLPYLGFLFRKNEKTDTKTELLVFITPKIVSDTLSLR
ncbi:MAG: type IV pilus secretin PilQ [Sterolibacteriaceae bacterium MAG5]|nr:type IV pilus secretin PilQ [Candidatus Nitricoxidireducens bremensis]